MVTDDRDAYPMNCGAEFVFDGQMQREAFEVAFRSALARHPMANARLGQGIDGKLTWLKSDIQPSVRWVSADSPNLEFANPMPIRWGKEAPVRAWVQASETETKLQFEWHHALFDAAGGMQFMEDLFVFYANDLSKCTSFEPRPLDNTLLAQRGRVVSPIGRGLLGRVAAIRKDISKSYRLGTNPPVALAAANHGETPEQRRPRQSRYIVRHFGHEYLRSLRCVASEQGATFNDLVLKNLFVVVRKWNERHGATGSDRHIRVVMPMSLRGAHQREMPAANCLSYAFLTRSGNEIESNQLLGSIRDETHDMRKYLLPVGMLRKLGLLARLGINMKGFFKDDDCCGTALLTNLGDPTRRFHNRFPREQGLIRVGNLLLKNIVGIAPLRPLTRAVFDVFTYGNRLSVALRCDPYRFDDADSAALLDLFIDELDELRVAA